MTSRNCGQFIGPEGGLHHSPQIKKEAKSQNPQFHNLKEKNSSQNLNELGSELFSAKTPGNNAAADTAASRLSAEDLVK